MLFENFQLLPGSEIFNKIIRVLSTVAWSRNLAWKLKNFLCHDKLIMTQTTLFDN